ncbi:M56 family metallopeptidase [Xanthomonas arboricola pv. juglandis]|uniref:M56 family metallopeptidase n=1 Tax=Xanthomonas arboricola TaxID=56448 RepID=UPI001AF530C4|nr:M56 family metallopeptidase [Xanthomonas arboricola]CAG2082129.1 M56 family metallopeptidase [Xanthomonas arboricola pv. juglandis]
MSPMIEALLWRLGATSVQTAVLALAVWALCRSVRRLPATTQTWLWWLVGVQAVIGLLWNAPLQLPVLPAATSTPALIAGDSLAPMVMANATASGTSAVASAGAVDVLQGASGPSWALWLAALWVAGVAVMALGTLRAYRRSRALVRAAAPCTDRALVAALRMAAEAHGLSQPPEIRLSQQIVSPQLIGPWRPVLLLPAARLPHMADDDLDMALTHELIHLRRRDLWWGLPPSLAQHLFFFHPLVHLAAREYATAREAACDAAVVAGHRHCRHDYGRLLLQLGVAPRPHGGVASASPSFLSLKRRLLMLQNPTSFPRFGAALILGAVAITGVLPLRLVAMPAAPAVAAASAAAPAKPAAGVSSTAAPATAAAAAAPATAAATAAPANAAAPAAAASSTSQTFTTTSTHGQINLSHDPDRDAYVLLQGNDSVMNGSVDDLKHVRRLAGKDGQLMWFRKDGKQYVVRDPDTFKRLNAVYAPVTKLGQAQGALGERQGELGEQQGELGAQMGELGARAADAAAKHVNASLLDTDARTQQAAERAAREAERAVRQAEQAMQRSGAQQRMQALARQQAALATEQADLASQQAAASVRADKEAQRIMREAIAQGLATQIEG